MPAPNDNTVHGGSLRERMAFGIANREFTLAYQPQYALDTGEMMGKEGLLRWHHATPDVFIPVAEQHGMVETLGLYAFEMAARQISEWRKNGRKVCKVYINVSPLQLRKGFANVLCNILDNECIPTSMMGLEITENFNSSQPSSKELESLKEIKLCGFTLSLDDFGMNETSLRCLQWQIFDEIKLDRSIVANIHSSSVNYLIIKNISNMARDLGVKLVAEGIETIQQVEKLIEAGVMLGQGYLLQKPVAPDCLYLGHAATECVFQHTV